MKEKFQKGNLSGENRSWNCTKWRAAWWNKLLLVSFASFTLTFPDSLAFSLRHCDVHATGERGNLSAESYGVETLGFSLGHAEGTVQCVSVKMSLPISLMDFVFWLFLSLHMSLSLMVGFLWCSLTHPSTNLGRGGLWLWKGNVKKNIRLHVNVTNPFNTC